MCVLNLKFWITQISQNNMIFLIQDESVKKKKKSCIYSKHNTQAIFKDYSSNLRYILNIYRKAESIQISVFCYCTIFFIRR